MLATIDLELSSLTSRTHFHIAHACTWYVVGAWQCRQAGYSNFQRMNMKTSSVFVKDSHTPKRQWTAARSPCTPKTNTRQATPSRARTPLTYNDRYVPSRSAGDVEFSRFQISTPPRSALKSAENSARNNVPSGCAMRECLLGLKGQSSENRVLAFHQPGPADLAITTTGKCKLLLRWLVLGPPLGLVSCGHTPTWKGLVNCLYQSCSVLQILEECTCL